ncbi:hypothetical protein P9250_05395 [Caballeronia sp. LP006]|jgi:hypothetical protein|uniref:hypothetical protein n=1 Tax=unclassified Caballeronia TaxID=2646786 RepID=UPI001FCF7F9D|nr:MULTISPECIES: hypothetical protein [unclassified Caballeronia]MDR5799484.1 hypothetical protein [Caballeronia sp. LZ001]MDR5827298.1 hypothetical protein [Caballeronia sp. LP006]
MPFRLASNGFFFALWVAVCAAAPEFLWQGLFSLFGHFSFRDAAAALLIGAILAFFVEPLLERLRGLQGHVHRAEKSPAFAACEALSFAVVAVCVHEAITVYVAASHSNEQASENLAKAVGQALQWAAIPFVITIAWMSARGAVWMMWTAAGLAVIFSYLTGVLFEWQTHVLVTSVIPAILVLISGCIIVREQWDADTFRRCARALAVIALAWLVLSGAVQCVLWLAHVQSFRLYDTAEFFSDLRFYIGWVTGLLVAPGIVAPALARPDDDQWKPRL